MTRIVIGIPCRQPHVVVRLQFAWSCHFYSSMFVSAYAMVLAFNFSCLNLGTTVNRGRGKFSVTQRQL
jgi:hypothetical protein